MAMALSACGPSSEVPQMTPNNGETSAQQEVVIDTSSEQIPTVTEPQEEKVSNLPYAPAEVPDNLKQYAHPWLPMLPQEVVINTTCSPSVTETKDSYYRVEDFGTFTIILDAKGVNRTFWVSVKGLPIASIKMQGAEVTTDVRKGFEDNVTFWYRLATLNVSPPETWYFATIKIGDQVDAIFFNEMHQSLCAKQ